MLTELMSVVCFEYTYFGGMGPILFCMGCCICIPAAAAAAAAAAADLADSGVRFFWCLSNSSLPKSSHHSDSIAAKTRR